MSTKIPDVRKKLDAIETLVGTLSGFEEGDVNDIIAFARKQLGFGGSNAATPMPSVSGSTEGSPQSPLTDNIAQFVGQKEPKNEYQRVAVLAYFLYHARGVKNFTLKEIKEANADARQPSFSNIHATVNKALTRYKFLTQGSGGQRGVYTISFDGEKLVNALPSLEGTALPTGKRGANRRIKKSAKAHKE